jgi:Flp pilus assembly protein TadG
VLVEFSLVFVLFAFICYALVAFGLAMNLKSNLTHAAGEGARAAVGAGQNADGTPNPE